MAQAANVDTKDLTECGICLMTIEEPKALPCLHSFCLKCLSKWAEGKTDTIRCPICSQDFPIPQVGIKGFITNFVINTLKERKELVELLHAKDARFLCSCCGTTDINAEAYCSDCGGFICQECGGPHRRVLVFQDHKTIPFQDLQSGKVDIKSVMKQQYCKEHKGQVLRFYCKTCGVLICHECTVIDHPTASHVLVNLKHASKEHRTEIKQLMMDCVEVNNMVEDSLKKAEQVQQTAKKGLKKAMEDIQAAADEACRQIREKRKQQEAVLMQSVTVNNKQIEAQKESLQMQQTRLQTAIQMATEVTETRSDHDLALVFSSLKNNLSQLRSMKPGAVDDDLGEIKFTANPSLLSPVSHLGSVSVGKVGQGSVPSGVKGKGSTDGHSSSGPFPSKHRRRSIGKWKLVEQFGDQGQQKLQCGRHAALTSVGELIVTDKGNNSHGQVLVYGKSGNFKYSLDTKQGLKSGQTSAPWNVVVSPDGRIFITHLVSHVNVYDTNGTYKYRFPTKSPSNASSDAKDTILYGLALDNHGCLLVGDHGDEMTQMYISKHRLDGSHVSSMKVNILPEYIAVTSTDRVLISSGWAHPGSAQVLDSIGNVLHTLNPPSGMSSWIPCGICCTAGDDIYIANSASASNGGGIYCYSASGQHRGCITEEELSPIGLVLTENDNKLIVVEYSRVKIFCRQ